MLYIFSIQCHFSFRETFRAWSVPSVSKPAGMGFAPARSENPSAGFLKVPSRPSHPRHTLAGLQTTVLISGLNNVK